MRSRNSIRAAAAFALAAVLVALAAPTPAAAQSVEFKRGDANVDNYVTLSDAITGLSHIFLGNPAVLDCEKAADANDDGKLSLVDAIFTLSFLFVGTQAPPAPFPGCGRDPNADGLSCLRYPHCEFRLRRPSKSSTIAISDDDHLVVMVNPEADSISIFETAGNTLLAKVPTGDEPSAVVIHPDGKTAFVANRAAATVVKVEGIDSETPRVTATLPVGSEPAGLALSPSGRRLFVAEFAEGRILEVDSTLFEIADAIERSLHPRGLLVTNDGDNDDDDELLIAPEFFGEPVPGGEAKDDGRSGRVRIYSLADLSPTPAIVFNPIDSGFAPDGSAEGTPTVLTSPNQLYSVAIQGQKIYVSSVAASPAPPVKFNTNVQPVVWVGDLATRTQDPSTVNLALKVKQALPAGTTRFFLADLVDLAFFGNQGGVAYVLSRGADVIQRVVFDAAGNVSIGSAINQQIDIGTALADGTPGCQTPNGIVTAHDAPRAYVNCWVNRRLGVVNLATQSLLTTVPASDLGAEPSAASVAKGRRFFFTGRARWAREGWSACSSCHPDGLTDNITWSFAAGPRQTTSMDGTFSHGAGPQKQRILNWSAIFEELHDFERNTRGVSGGLGAVTISPTGQCGKLAEEVQDPPTANLPGNLAGPIKELQDRPENCTKDWDDIENFTRTIRPPRALQTLDPAAVARGALLFGEAGAQVNAGGCVRCHGGAGWTVSRRYWTPSTTTNAALAAAPFQLPNGLPLSFNPHVLQIAPQPASADSTGAPIPPAQVACVIRDLDTFGLPGDVAATDALEKKDNGSRAQGAGGFNVPSLYGLALGAPYLHHGQAQTLEQLFDDPKWAAHLNAGNPVFLLTGDAAQQKRDLVQFLLAIDAEAPEQPIPDGFDACPESF